MRGSLFIGQQISKGEKLDVTKNLTASEHNQLVETNKRHIDTLKDAEKGDYTLKQIKEVTPLENGVLLVQFNCGLFIHYTSGRSFYK